MTVRVSIFGKDTVHLKGENIDKRIPREDFATVAELIYAAIRQSREDDVTSPDGVEEFLDEVAILIWKLRRTTARISAWLLLGRCSAHRILCPFPSGNDDSVA